MRENIDQWKQQWQSRAGRRSAWNRFHPSGSIRSDEGLHANAVGPDCAERGLASPPVFVGDGPGSASKSRSRLAPHNHPHSLHPDVAAAEAAALSVLSHSANPVPRRRERESLHISKSRDIFNRWESIKSSARIAPSKKRSILRSGGGNGMFAVRWSGVLLPAILLILIGIFAVTAEEGRRHLREKLGAGGPASAHNDSVAFASAVAKSGLNGVPLPPRLERMMRVKEGAVKPTLVGKLDAPAMRSTKPESHDIENSRVKGAKTPNSPEMQSERAKVTKDGPHQHRSPADFAGTPRTSILSPAGKAGALPTAKVGQSERQRWPLTDVRAASKGRIEGKGPRRNATSSLIRSHNFTEAA